MPSVKRLTAISRRLRTVGFTAVVVAWACASSAASAGPETDPAAALRARHAVLVEQLARSPFPQHLYVESVDRAGASQGDVHAVVDYPIGAVSDAFSSPANWCDTLILHLNVKYCRPVLRGGRTVLSTAIGRNFEQSLSETYRVEFSFRVVASRPDYVHIELKARKGPLGTANYRILLEAVGLEDGRAFVHLRYSYTYGVTSGLAMRAYLATSGSGKVGFTIIGNSNGPHPKFVGGVRGAIERNTMRYYLAIDAYLGAMAAPAPERFEQSLERWFNATELYPRQLREVDRATYFAMKRSEYARQQTRR